MEDLVKKRRPPAALFWNVYTVPEAGIHPPPPGIAPAVVGLRRIRRPLSEELQALLDATATRGRLHVEYSAPTEFLALKKWRTDVAQRTLERLARAGVLEFSIPDDFVDERVVWKALATRSPFQFVCRVAGAGADDARARPRVTVLGRNPTPAQVQEALDVDRDQHLILYPSWRRTLQRSTTPKGHLRFHHAGGTGREVDAVSILNEPSDGTLSVLLALRGALRAYGPMPSDRLLSLCAPETVSVGDERPRFTLQRWIQLGAFVEEGGEIRLASELDSETTDELASLRTTLLGSFS